ncbi:MAG: META domain-containing protein [Desulfovibrionaceae bacterium]|nr:META domain-containing protein [Desulfovibrionaceae bacterium]
MPCSALFRRVCRGRGPLSVLMMCFLGACHAAESGPGPAASDLEGSRWRLAELYGQAVELYDGQPEPHIAFARPEEEEGGEARRGKVLRLSGSDGCNYLLGTLELSAAGARFSGMASTRRFCPEGDAQARRMARALEESDAVTVRGDTLELSHGGTPAARFTRTSP